MSSRKELAAAVYTLLDKGADSKQLARAVAAYLVETRQTKDVGTILRDLETVRFNRDGVLEIQVTSARPIGEQTLDSIKALFDAKHIVIHQETDPSILGGVKVRAHDKQLDTSVRTRLQRLKAGA